MANVLSCYFPTTVVLIDDSSSFLEILSETLSGSGVIFKQFTNPQHALEFINDTSAINRMNVADITAAGEESTSDWQSVMVSVNRLHREVYNPERFCRISAVVVDYAMPGMHGVDLCSKIKDKTIQRVLLTGVADERIAIDAFNAGYIERFIKKGAINFEEEVTESLDKCVYQYFNMYTEGLSSGLLAHNTTHLKDPIFANFFFNTCMNKTFVEYYMLDSCGSYMFLNAQGQPSLLSVLTENEMERLVDVGEASGEIAPDVLEGLKSRDYMLVYHNRSGMLPPVHEWGIYLQPSRRLEGYQTYYFAFADYHSLDVDLDQIRSFERFQLKSGLSI